MYRRLTLTLTTLVLGVSLVSICSLQFLPELVPSLSRTLTLYSIFVLAVSSLGLYGAIKVRVRRVESHRLVLTTYAAQPHSHSHIRLPLLHRLAPLPHTTSHGPQFQHQAPLVAVHSREATFPPEPARSRRISHFQRLPHNPALEDPHVARVRALSSVDVEPRGALCDGAVDVDGGASMGRASNA
jgi:hypothetical protein